MRDQIVVRLPLSARARLFSVALLAAACGGGPTSLSPEKDALGAALAKAGVLSGRVGGYSAFALAQISKTNKLTLVSDPAGGTSQFDAAAVIIVWDLSSISTTELGWYNGLVAWNGLSVADQTVDHMTTVGAAGGGKVVFTTINIDVGKIDSTRVGEATSYIKAGDAIYVGNSGNYTATSATFGDPKSCARPISVAPPVTCVYQIGTMTGSFNFVAPKFSGTGGTTLTQPAVTFSLPAIQVIISSN